MAIPHYGVWVAHPTRYGAEASHQDSQSPHIYIHFKDDLQSEKKYEAAINAKSTSKDTRLVFWLHRNFTSPLTDCLGGLENGFHLAKTHPNGPVDGIDFLRTRELVKLDSGNVLPHDIPGPNNDILDMMRPIVNDAIHHKATMYVFGSSYGTGIHDIHMNQGNLPHFDSAVNEDGAIFFHFPNGHWEAVFMAFASQKIPTDDETGKPLHDSQTMAQILGHD